MCIINIWGYLLHGLIFPCKYGTCWIKFENDPSGKKERIIIHLISILVKQQRSSVHYTELCSTAKMVNSYITFLGVSLPQEMGKQWSCLKAKPWGSLLIWSPAECHLHWNASRESFFTTVMLNQTVRLWLWTDDTVSCHHCVLCYFVNLDFIHTVCDYVWWERFCE